MVVTARYASTLGDNALLSATLSAAIKARTGGLINDLQLRHIIDLCWAAIPHEAAKAATSLDGGHPALMSHVASLQPGSLIACSPEVAEPEWLLAKANLATSSKERLLWINRAFECLGQTPIELDDESNGLCSRNLRSLSNTSTCRVKPVISVIMTCFNNASDLSSSIESVLGQTFSDLELIIVNDGSKDGSSAIVQAAAERDSRVRVQLLTHNVGTYIAKNLALSHARGTFIAFNDADDWSHPNRLLNAIKLFKADPILEAVSGHYFRLDENGNIYSPRVFPLIRWSPNTLIFRRNAVVSKIGYFDANRFGSDSEFVARLRSVFGERSHRKMKAVQFVAAHRLDSLMTGAQYGLDKTGHSNARQGFQEFWAERLLSNLVAGNVPYCPRILPPEFQ